MGQFEADGQLLVEQVDCFFDLLAGQMAPGLGNPKAGKNLLGTACRDAPQVKAVAALPATTFGEIQRHRIGSSLALVGQLGMPLPKNFHQWPEVSDGFKSDIQRNESGNRAWFFGGVHALC